MVKRPRWDDSESSDSDQSIYDGPDWNDGTVKKIATKVLLEQSQFVKVLVTGDCSTKEARDFWRRILRAYPVPEYEKATIREAADGMSWVFSECWPASALEDFDLVNSLTICRAIRFIQRCRDPMAALATVTQYYDISAIMQYAANPDWIDRDLKRVEDWLEKMRIAVDRISAELEKE